jgi:hypothetical protein
MQNPIRISDLAAARISEQVLKLSQLPTQAISEQVLKLSPLPTQAISEQVLKLSELPMKAISEQVQQLLKETAAVGNSIAADFGNNADRLSAIAEAVLEAQTADASEQIERDGAFRNWDKHDVAVMWWSMIGSLSLLLAIGKESADKLTQLGVKYVIGFLTILALLRSLQSRN